MLCYKIIVPYTNSSDFFWPLIVGGIGLGLLSVPISTVARSTLNVKAIGGGAALTGMMRQHGGFFEIALISTYPSRQSSLDRINFISHLKAAMQNRVSQLADIASRKDFDSLSSCQVAYQLLEVRNFPGKHFILLSYFF